MNERRKTAKQKRDCSDIRIPPHQEVPTREEVIQEMGWNLIPPYHRPDLQHDE